MCMGIAADENEVITRIEFQSAHGCDNLPYFDAADAQGKGHLTKPEYIAAFGETTQQSLHNVA